MQIHMYLHMFPQDCYSFGEGERSSFHASRQRPFVLKFIFIPNAVRAAATTRPIQGIILKIVGPLVKTLLGVP